MTQRERELSTFFLDKIEAGIAGGLRGDDGAYLEDAAAALRFLRDLLADAHSAQAHAPKRRRRKAKGEAKPATRPSTDSSISAMDPG